MNVFTYIENIVYEWRPYAYLVFAGGSYKHGQHSSTVVFAAAVLCLCGLYVLKLRYDHRRAPKKFNIR